MSSVILHCYDQGEGYACLLGQQAIWHVGLEIKWQNGPSLEYCYGDRGIIRLSHSDTFLDHPLKKSFDLGNTEASYADFEKSMESMERVEFQGRKYNLLTHNCQHFAKKVINLLELNSKLSREAQNILNQSRGLQHIPGMKFIGGVLFRKVNNSNHAQVSKGSTLA